MLHINCSASSWAVEIRLRPFCPVLTKNLTFKFLPKCPPAVYRGDTRLRELSVRGSFVVWIE